MCGTIKWQSEENGNENENEMKIHPKIMLYNIFLLLDKSKYPVWFTINLLSE